MPSGMLYVTVTLYLNTIDDLFPYDANHLPGRIKQRLWKQVKNHMVLTIKAQRSDYVLSTYYISGTFNVLLEHFNTSNV